MGFLGLPMMSTNDGLLTLSDDSIEWKPPVKLFGGSDEGGTKSLDGVSARVESGADLQSRFTVTRLALLGPFALALKKKKGGEKYLTIEGPDFVWALEVDRKKANEAMKFASRVNGAAKAYAQKNPRRELESAASDPGDPYEEVKKLKELLDMGIVSQEEFDAKKNQLLGL